MATQDRAYIASVYPSSFEKDATGDDIAAHQSSPAWVLTFVRWENRDTKRYDTSSRDNFGPLSTREPLVVVNDCVQVSVSQSKSQHTPQMQATLLAGDINYMTALNPGDFVFVNMLKWEKYAQQLGEKAQQKKPINGPDDGFKGLFKIQSIRQILMTDHMGKKRVAFQIAGFGMTELNNTIYLNDQLLLQNASPELGFMRVGARWNDLVLTKGQNNNVEQILKVLINIVLGSGVDEKGKKDKVGNLVSPNDRFYVPLLVGQLLGEPKAKVAADIYNFMFGIQEYSPNSTRLQDGLNPKFKNSKDGRYYETPVRCQGATLVYPEYWNQVTGWSIMKQHSNTPINELFTAFKLSPDGRVMPTVVLRQMPFSTLSYEGISTKFLNLPRWKIDPGMIEMLNIGKDEAARINFVQVFGQNSLIANSGSLIADQLVKGNFDIDAKDIGRSGLKPYIINSNMDFPVTDKELSKAPVWSKLLGDALIGGQNKLNGSIHCIGISMPIAPGDNLQMGDTVFHIESVNHECAIQANGMKSFNTVLMLSNGVSISSSPSQLVYPESDFVDMDNKRANDPDNIYPGVTDIQFSLDATGENTVRNKGGEKFKKSVGPSFTPNKRTNSVPAVKQKKKPDKAGPKGKS